MAVFDQIRLLYLKKDLICTLLILKRRKFARQKGKRVCWVRKIRSSRWQMLLNIVALENLSNFTGKYLCWSLFFNNRDFITKHWWLYYKRPYLLKNIGVCFPVKFVMFLITPSFTEHFRWLLLENLFRSSRKRGLHITGEIFDRGYFFC